jgi:hypothetical protein
MPWIRGSRARVTQASEWLARFRWAFMPLGLCALVAVGVHAAADAVDDRLLWGLDRLDAGFDRLFDASPATHAWALAVGAKERTFFARAVTLLWELAADVVLALPLLKYAEESDPEGRAERLLPVDSDVWPTLVHRVRSHPSALRWAYPLICGAITLAGACELARMVQGATFLSARAVLPDGGAGLLARVGALSCLGLLLASFGWRVCLRSFEHAEGLTTRRVGMGLALTVPLALAALVDASSLLAFFR